MAPCRSRSTTPGRACRARTSCTCSSRSRRAGRAASAWGWRPCGASSRITEAACHSPASPAPAPACSSRCPMPDKILVVDDEPAMRRSLAIMLRREGYTVGEAPDGGLAVEYVDRDTVDLVIADLRMNGVSGLDVLRHVKRAHPDVEVILMTAYGTIEAAVDAMRLGAYDFVTKPFEMEQVLLRVRNALERRRLKSEVHRLRAEAASAFSLDAIVGSSEAIQKILAVIPLAAKADSTMLITGESGTGKELVARAIHGGSRRVGGPFVAVSCAALPDQLLENELFGHVKGAFSGAVPQRKGLFEEANRGTFFLDEIGEASPRVQAKLLRVLEERMI